MPEQDSTLSRAKSLPSEIRTECTQERHGVYGNLQRMPSVESAHARAAHPFCCAALAFDAGAQAGLTRKVRSLFLLGIASCACLLGFFPARNSKGTLGHLGMIFTAHEICCNGLTAYLGAVPALIAVDVASRWSNGPTAK